MTAPYTAAELAAILKKCPEFAGYWMGSDISAAETIRRLVAELTRAREALREYGEHHTTCAKRLLKHAICKCGLDAALGEEPADGDTEY